MSVIIVKMVVVVDVIIDLLSLSLGLSVIIVKMVVVVDMIIDLFKKEERVYITSIM